MLKELTVPESLVCKEIASYRWSIGKRDEEENGGKLNIRKASMGEPTGRRISRYIKQLGVTRIFEVGTCVGIGAAYMCTAAATNGSVTYYGMEGVDAKMKLALRTLSKFCKDADTNIFSGHFDDSFELALEAARPLEFVYLDGRHKKKPSLDMFDRITAVMMEDSGGGVLLADDLNHSSMGDCRKQFRQHKHVFGYVGLTQQDLYVIGDRYAKKLDNYVRNNNFAGEPV